MAYTFKHGDRPLEGYTIQRGIGRGGFGEVYYAISDGGREVALKYLRDNPQIELRGVSNCMNLKSPYLVTIFDVKQSSDGDYFIIMEYISGASLAELLAAESNGMGPEKAAFFLREIAKGLAFLHDRGIVHRDLKPGNIFYEDGYVKIGDYGLSKFISLTRHSAQTASVGTVHYMAPEVGSGNYHRGIDIYALGVMLYEMLLGRVPFEGSTMGEILMKHLTEQPEVEDMPAPFGSVIRKALAKDPNDRYQNVDEMLEALLEVSEVRDSLAGFNPTSIIQPARRVREGAREPVPSPVPSPNIPRAAAPYAQPVPPAPLDVGEIPARVRKRIDRVSEKVARRMDKLAGRPHTPWHRRWQKHRQQGHAQVQSPPRDRVGAFKGFVLAAITTVGIAVGLGFLIGIANDEPIAGVSAGMMVVAMTFGVAFAMKVTQWLGTDAQPNWIRRMVLLGCCAPPMLVSALPMVEEMSAWGTDAMAVPIGLLIVALFANWDDRVESGARGEWSIGRALWIAFGALIVTAIVSGVLFDSRHEDQLMMIGAAVAGAVSLVIQSISWFLPLPGFSGALGGHRPDRQDPASRAVPGPAAEPGADETVAVQPPPPPIHGRAPHQPSSDIPLGIPVAAGTPVGGRASTHSLLYPRLGISRAFWGLVAMLLLLASVGSFIFAGVVDHKHHEELAAGITVGIACGAFMLFALQKLTPHKRRGLWRETLCPFLIALMMTSLGACITILATQRLANEEFTFTVFGIVASSLLLLVLLIARIYGIARPFPSGHTSGSANGAAAPNFMVGVGAFVLDDRCDAEGGGPAAEGGANA